MSRIQAGNSSTTGGGGTPGGANTDVQYNNSGSFGGNSGFTYDGANVTVGNGVVSAVDFIFSRQININITVPDGSSMINSNMHLNGTVLLTLLGDSELILL